VTVELIACPVSVPELGIESEFWGDEARAPQTKTEDVDPTEAWVWV
jgi:hypothetical protein